MRRRAGRPGHGLAFVALALLTGSAAPAEQPAPSPSSVVLPERVVSLNPSLTAMLVTLGAGDRLVGVDDFSAQTEPVVAALPRVGGLYNPSLEAVAALRPDLVVLVPSAEQRDFRARLASLGVPLLELDPVSFDDVLETVETLGARVGLSERARARTDEIRRVRRAVEAACAALPRRRAVLVLQRDPTFVVGRGSFVDDMLGALGVVNLAAVFEEPYPRVTREWLIDAAPDTLIDSSRSREDAAGYWSQWPSIPAVRAGRVATLPEGLATLPGPHLDRALLTLAEAVHGPAPFAHLREPSP